VDVYPRQGDVEKDKDALYRVAYEEATRARSEQLALIDSFRSRAGLLLSAAAITTSFLGRPSFDLLDRRHRVGLLEFRL
jgi:hypothetical protein